MINENTVLILQMVFAILSLSQIVAIILLLTTSNKKSLDKK